MGIIDNKEAMIDQIKAHWLVRVNDGTGVIVSPLDNTIFYVFTCKHVIQDKNGNLPSKDDISVRYDAHTSGNNHNFEVAEIVINDDEQNDVATLVVKRDLDNIPHVYPSSDKTDCFHIGFPQNRINAEGNFQNALVMNISNFDGDSDDGMIEYQSQVIAKDSELAGMSGGGIFNKEGKLIGIHTQSSMADNKEMLGKEVMIPVSLYLKLIEQKGLSPILEYDLQEFGGMVNWIFDFEGQNQKYVAKRASQFLCDIDEYKVIVQKWSPMKIFEVLKQNEIIKSDVNIESLNQDYWKAFTLFVVGIIAFLGLDENDGEKVIVNLYGNFHYCYSKEMLDVYDVREKLDAKLIVGKFTGAYLIVGGLNKTVFYGSYVPPEVKVPYINKAERISENDISRSRSNVFNKMTILNNNIFESAVEDCANNQNIDKVSIEHYREKLKEIIKV